MPLKLKTSDYAEATGVIRAIEKRLVGADALERALDAGSAAGALRALSQAGGYDFGSLARAADYEGVLKRELRNTYALLYKLSPDPDVVEILGAKYDYHNVKASLKARYASDGAARAASGSVAGVASGSTSGFASGAASGSASSHASGSSEGAARAAPGILYSVTRTPPQAVAEAVQSGDYRGLPALLADAAAQGAAAFEAAGAPGSIDLALDRLMYADMRRRADRLGNGLISEFTQKAIDFYNLRSLFRVRSMGARADARLLGSALADGGTLARGYFLDVFAIGAEAILAKLHYKHFGEAAKAAAEDHGRSGNYALLEKLADDSLMGLAKRAKMVAFGPEPLFAYLYAKETELKQIRVIATGKLNHVPNESIRKRLRGCYV